MFSRAEKRFIAEKIQEILLSLNHPEMPMDKPRFLLHVDGKEAWSWADIEPNWMFVDKDPKSNPWNEVSREVLQKVVAERTNAQILRGIYSFNKPPEEVVWFLEGTCSDKRSAYIVRDVLATDLLEARKVLRLAPRDPEWNLYVQCLEELIRRGSEKAGLGA